MVPTMFWGMVANCQELIIIHVFGKQFFWLRRWLFHAQWCSHFRLPGISMSISKFFSMSRRLGWVFNSSITTIHGRCIRNDFQISRTTLLATPFSTYVTNNLLSCVLNAKAGVESLSKTRLLPFENVTLTDHSALDRLALLQTTCISLNTENKWVTRVPSVVVLLQLTVQQKRCFK